MNATAAHVLGGRYRLEAVLGRGGIATVWAGVDTRLDRPVAVKVLGNAPGADRALLRRLDEEARTLARLAHPNIVSVYDLGTEAGVPYVVMELVEGDDLRKRLARGPLDLSEAVRIATQICDALQAAHESGVVHRDIKPDNVLLTASGLVKVCDFGIARLQASSSADATGHGPAVGTAPYMAPEQAVGAPVDARADLYALGCVLYEMLTGRPPFAGDDPQRVLWQQVHDSPATVASHRPDVPGDLDALIKQLLTKASARRPASAREVRARLDELGGAAFVRSRTASDGGRTTGHGRATVVARTQAMPPVESAVDDRAYGRFRLGPAGIVGVAMGAALVTALVVALIMLRTRPVQPTGSPGAGSVTATIPAPTSAQPSSTGTVSDVRAVILAQDQAGHLERGSAEDLLDKLDEIERHLADGRDDKAAERIDKLREKVNELARDDKITRSAQDAIIDSLDELARSLPESVDRDDDDD